MKTFEIHNRAEHGLQAPGAYQKSNERWHPWYVDLDTLEDLLDMSRLFGDLIVYVPGPEGDSGVLSNNTTPIIEFYYGE